MFQDIFFLYAVRWTSRRVNPVASFTVPEPSTIHLPFAMIFAVKFKILFESFFTVLRFINTATKRQDMQRDRGIEEKTPEKRKAYHIFLTMGQILKSCLQANFTIRDLRDLMRLRPISAKVFSKV